MDEDSLVVAYDAKRGEPRKGGNVKSEERGDCINCFKCVAVCPTGIDIRNGIQMECIACTSCIDACNEIMRITNKPKGLIRYESENGLKGKKKIFWKMKTNIYLGLTIFSVIGLFLFIFNRSGLDITVLRAHESPYQVLETAKEKTLIANHFTLNFKNQSTEKIEVDIIRSEHIISKEIEVIAVTLPVTIPPGQAKKNHIFIKFPKSILEGRSYHKFILHIVTKSKERTQKYRKEITLAGPV
ncbi:polyferredoxin [Candidatus Scalindua japonica]|uniref:Polyferredoxin n=2 Tax=Candidatus Scalindua japonica TaxID=1284222 RepID=A0A286U135_9BACT|nr:polyferredoxin [Candidatus Scalindua japonica]